MQATQNSQPPAQIESNLDPWKTGIPLDSDLLDTSKLPVDRVEGIYIKRDGGRVKSMCWPSRHTAIVALAATHKEDAGACYAYPFFPVIHHKESGAGSERVQSVVCLEHAMRGGCNDKLFDDRQVIMLRCFVDDFGGRVAGNLPA
jgi:hypothetical protein